MKQKNYKIIFKLSVNIDTNASPLFLLRQLSIFRGRVRCLEQIMQPTQRAELNLKANMVRLWHSSRVFGQCTKVEGKQWNLMDSPSDAPLSLRMPHLWQNLGTIHHTHPLVITGTGLAGLSNIDAQRSQIHHPKGKDLYPMSKPFKMQTLFHSFASQAAADLASGVTTRSRKTISESQSSRGQSKSCTWQVKGSRALKDWSVKHSTPRRNLPLFFSSGRALHL